MPCSRCESLMSLLASILLRYPCSLLRLPSQWFVCSDSASAERQWPRDHRIRTQGRVCAACSPGLHVRNSRILISVQKSIARRIPGAKLVEFPNNGHFFWVVHYKSLVLQLLGR